MRFSRCLAFAASLVFCALPMNAQLPTGSIDGIIKDPSGRLIQGAKVVATGDFQGAVRESNTNGEGAFTLSNLAPGSYTLLLRSPGFADVRYSQVQVQPGKATTLDTTFQIAAQASTILVGAESGQEVDLTPGRPRDRRMLAATGIGRA